MEAGSEEEAEGRTSRQTAGGGNGRGGSFHGLDLLPPVNDAALMISLHGTAVRSGFACAFLKSAQFAHQLSNLFDFHSNRI